VAEQTGFLHQCYVRLGAFFSEAAVLIFVFGNLDEWLHRQYKLANIFESFGTAAVFLLISIIFDRWAKTYD
jgi:hypothetical protein